MQKADPTKWNPDHVARWVCIACGAVLMVSMVAGAVVTIMRHRDLQSPETFTGGILLALGLCWYGSRSRAGQVAERVTSVTAKVPRRKPSTRVRN